MNIVPHKKVLHDLKNLLIQMDVDSFCHKNETLLEGLLENISDILLNFTYVVFPKKELKT